MIIPKHPESPHIAGWTEIFGVDYREAEVPEPSAGEAERRNVFICFVNRSGSYWLSEALASSGRIPFADEDFTVAGDTGPLKRLQLGSFPEYCRWLSREKAHNGVFATKVSENQLFLLCETGVIPRFYRRNDFVVIRRRDLLAQAISLTIARGTGQWKADQPVTGSAEFDFGKLQRRIAGLAAKNALFDAFFAMNGLEHHVIYYEDFVADPAGVVAGAADFLGIEGVRYDAGTVRMRRQEDSRKREWRERFLEMEGEKGRR